MEGRYKNVLQNGIFKVTAAQTRQARRNTPGNNQKDGKERNRRTSKKE